MLIDISLPIQSGAVFRLGSPPVEIESRTCFDEAEAEYDTTIITMPVHTGTHVDLVSKDRSVELYRMVSPGRLIDITHVKGLKVGLKEIEDVAVQPNETIIFRTDWSRYVDTARYYQHPELTLEVVEWLIAKGINMVGIDALGLGQGAIHGKYDRLLAKYDVYVLENLANLAAVPQSTFKVYCFPLALEHVDAIPARVVVEV